ncbi:hypothetical protein TorRG33x02_115550 [Trema orientale]|uniref:Uncharacterized protein n=1 Tax=Trema orientale TaxID=63057 RepID=A0A2P5F4J0_TREOI|nr:hypothetical protein TorRG33x02_115550 [Trema orientale]
MDFCALRAQPKKFGISFIVPDRLAVEISDKKTIVGKHPMRITRIPLGGPTEFHRVVEEAEKESRPLKKYHENVMATGPNPKKAYHRSHMNDWHPKVFYTPIKCLDEE